VRDIEVEPNEGRYRAATARSREKLFPLSAANVEERLRMSKNVSAELKGFSWSRDFEV